MKTIKVENCHTCPYIARKPYNCWYCGKTGITIDDIEGIHPDCPLPDHFPDATKKVESECSSKPCKLGNPAHCNSTDCGDYTVSEPSEAGNSSKTLRADPAKLIKWAKSEIKEYEKLIEMLGGKP